KDARRFQTPRNNFSADCMAGLRYLITTSSEPFSNSSYFSGVKISFAAVWPNSRVHLVSTSKRRVGWPRALVNAVWPSLDKSQFKNTLAALGWAGFLSKTTLPLPEAA